MWISFSCIHVNNKNVWLFWIDTVDEYWLQWMFLFPRWSSRAAFPQPSISWFKSCSQEKKETGMTPLHFYRHICCKIIVVSREMLMVSCWLHFMMCTCSFVWVWDRQIILLWMLSVQTWLRCFLSVCFMLIWKAEERTLFPHSPPTQQLSTPLSSSSSSLLLFHKIFTLRVELLPASSFLRHSQMSAAVCLSGLRAALSHLYLEFGKETDLV